MNEIKKAIEQEKIREYLYQGGTEDSYNQQVAYMRGHKETCERWLEFLKAEVYMRLAPDGGYTNDTIKQKKKDLQETIKFYEERGIE